jgi:tetratricopeptide (TPR) repeat protein
MAMAYYQLNRLQEAKAPLADSLQRWPDLFPLNMLYGAVLLKLNDQAAAYEALHHAHELNPQDQPTIDMLYVAAARMAVAGQAAGRNEESLRYWTEAAKLHPQEAEPHARMAELYTAAGKPAEAKAEAQAADRLASNHPH